MMTKCVSPWYNHTGWLGVKHQFTYVLLTVLGGSPKLTTSFHDASREWSEIDDSYFSMLLWIVQDWLDTVSECFSDCSTLTWLFFSASVTVPTWLSSYCCQEWSKTDLKFQRHSWWVIATPRLRQLFLKPFALFICKWTSTRDHPFKGTSLLKAHFVFVLKKKKKKKKEAGLFSTG